MNNTSDIVKITTLLTSAICILAVVIGCVIILVFDNINHVPVSDFVQSMIQSFVLLAVGTLGLHIPSGDNNGRQS